MTRDGHLEISHLVVPRQIHKHKHVLPVLVALDGRLGLARGIDLAGGQPPVQGRGGIDVALKKRRQWFPGLLLVLRRWHNLLHQGPSWPSLCNWGLTRHELHSFANGLPRVPEVAQSILACTKVVSRPSTIEKVRLHESRQILLFGVVDFLPLHRQGSGLLHLLGPAPCDVQRGAAFVELQRLPFRRLRQRSRGLGRGGRGCSGLRGPQAVDPILAGRVAAFGITLLLRFRTHLPGRGFDCSLLLVLALPTPLAESSIVILCHGATCLRREDRRFGHHRELQRQLLFGLVELCSARRLVHLV
mmetsp:Transcript_31945/g.105944  ORF Transcript_31945/g.105944 Transcript_31945/m.105944 type:complete len:302 (+) Transcript_31945:697-1602(+)